jgi:hypothetical protein
MIRGVHWAPKEPILRKGCDGDNWPLTWADDSKPWGNRRRESPDGAGSAGLPDGFCLSDSVIDRTNITGFDSQNPLGGGRPPIFRESPDGAGSYKEPGPSAFQ